MTARRWDHRLYGNASDPVRQSDLNDIAGGYACPKRFAYRKREEAAALAAPRERTFAKTLHGTAVHDVLERALTHEHYGPAILSGTGVPSSAKLLERYRAQFLEAAGGVPIDWQGEKADDLEREAVFMVQGVLRDVARRASRVIGCEVPFRAVLADYHVVGTIDFVYELREGGIAFADYKTGEQRLSQVVIDHGYQVGLYAHALHEGTLWPGTDRERRLGQFPARADIVHLRDYLPYPRRQTKTVQRPEEAEFFGFPVGTSIAIDPGNETDGSKKKRARASLLPTVVLRDRRGPAWYRARRTLEDVARLAVSLRNIVSTVRLGRFVERLDDDCDRCAFRGPCLNDGYAPAGEERAELERALRAVDLTQDDLAA